MRVRLRGINSRRKRLADGTIRTHPLPGPGRAGHHCGRTPGTAEFIASYNEAVAQKVVPPAWYIVELAAAVSGQRRFPPARRQHAAQLRPADRAHCRLWRLSVVRAERPAHTRRIHGMARQDCRGSGRRQADYAWTVLARVLSWSLNRGLMGTNPCERGGRLYRGRAPIRSGLPTTRRVPSALRRIFTCRSCWRCGPDNGKATCCGSRGPATTGRISSCGSRRPALTCRSRLALHSRPRSITVAKRATVILTNRDGKPWTSDGFRASWGKACKAAGIVGVTFHDLRGTAVTRLALVDCTEAQIATITGHSLRDVHSILDANYLHRDPALGDSAITKLERGTKTPN